MANSSGLSALDSLAIAIGQQTQAITQLVTQQQQQTDVLVATLKQSLSLFHGQPTSNSLPTISTNDLKKELDSILCERYRTNPLFKGVKTQETKEILHQLKQHFNITSDQESTIENKVKNVCTAIYFMLPTPLHC